jgi:hypothetical protein
MVYFPIDDPYLLLYLSSFLTIRDFIHLSRTSRLFADDPLITDELTKRIRSNISAEFISFTNDQIYTENVGIYEFSDTTVLVFPIKPLVPMLEFTQDVPSERLSFDIQTPNWRFRWSGVLYNNVIENAVIHIAKSPFASIQVVANRDSDIVFLTEIRFRFARNIPDRLRRERRKWFWQMTVLAIFALYTVFGSNELIIRIELVVYGIITGYYLTRSVPSFGNLVPCPTYT